MHDNIIEYLDSLPYPQRVWEKDTGYGVVRRKYVSSGQLKILAREALGVESSELRQFDNQGFYYDLNYNRFGGFLKPETHEAIERYVRKRSETWKEERDLQIRSEMNSMHCDPEETMHVESRVHAEEYARILNHQLRKRNYHDFEVVVMGSIPSSPDRAVYELRYFGEQWVRGFREDVVAELPNLATKLIGLDKQSLDSTLPVCKPPRKRSVRL